MSLAIEGQWIGDALAGRFTTRHGDRVIARHRLAGRVLGDPAPGPDEAVYTLELHRALGEGRFLRLRFPCREGRFRAGFGFSPTFNKAPHRVDPAGLRLEGDRLSGEAKVSIQPDAWVPRDHRPIDCRYRIDVGLAHRLLSGSFSGKSGEAEVRGPVTGRIDPAPALSRATELRLKLMDGLTGGTAWQNRAFVSLRIEDGHAAGGTIGNNKPAARWKGELTAATVELEDTRLEVSLAARVDSRGPVSGGQYRFELAGQVVGEQVVGDFQARLEGSRIEGGRFLGSIDAAGPVSRSP